MDSYRNILAVLDLGEHSGGIARRAMQVARSWPGARLSLLHVVESPPIEPLGDSLMPALQIDEVLLEKARQHLARLATSLGDPAPAWDVVTGNAKAQIVRVARERDVDLIVIGCRVGRKLSRLVNFTEDTILHAAHCDVLAVRLVHP